MPDLRMRVHSVALLKDIASAVVYKAELPEGQSTIFDPAQGVVAVDRRCSWQSCRVGIMHAASHLLRGDQCEIPSLVDDLEAEIDAARRLIPVELLAECLAMSWDPKDAADYLGVDEAIVVVRCFSLTDAERYMLRRLSDDARRQLA